MTTTARELRKAELRTIAAAIAEELNATEGAGRSWTTEDRHPEYPGLHIVRATDGARLHIRQGGTTQEAGRLVVAADEPHDVEDAIRRQQIDSYGLMFHEPRATYAPDRPARAIARDLARRIVPVLTTKTAEVRALLASKLAHVDATERGALELAAAIGGRVDVERHSGKVTGRVFLPGHGADVEVSGDRVRFDRMSSVTVDQAARIAAILAERD